MIAEFSFMKLVFPLIEYVNAASLNLIFLFFSDFNLLASLYVFWSNEYHMFYRYFALFPATEQAFWIFQEENCAS